MRSAFGGLVLAAGFSALGASGAAAQEADGGGRQVDEIVVTAQRRGENLQKVPIAVTAITAGTLQATGTLTTRDLQSITPALQLPSQNGYVLPRLRGVGSTAFGPGIDSPIATYVNGVYIASSPSALFALNDVERVEVLKGPQGTLFGRNSTGGVIQVITREPQPGFAARFEASYANYQTPLVSADAGGGSDAFRVGGALQYSYQGKGWGRNFYDGRDVNRVDDDLSGRVTIVARPASRLTVRLYGDYSQLTSSYPNTRTFAAQPLAALPNPPPGSYDVRQNVNARFNNRQGGVTGNATLDLDAVKLVSITGYRRSRFQSRVDLDRTPAAGSYLDSIQRDNQFSEELQLMSNRSGGLDWRLGGYYFRSNSRYDPSNVYAGPAVTSLVGNERTTSYAVYGQATYPLTARLNATVGLRYTSEGRSANVTQTRIVLATRARTTLAGLSDVTTHYHPLTWRGALDYKLARDVLVYASVSRGFKSGGFNLQTPVVTAPFLPERLDDYEVGVKSELFGRTLRLNVAGFYYDYRNILVTYSPVPGTLGTINGPSAKVYGADVDLAANLGGGVRLTGAVTAMRARFGDFPLAIYAYAQPNGSNLIGTAASFGTNADGHLINYTAELSGNIGLTYTTRVAGGRIDAATNLYYNDGFYPEVDNFRRQARYVNLTASLGWTSASCLSIRVWGRNLTDARVISSLLSNANGTAVSFLAPRTYGVTVGKSF